MKAVYLYKRRLIDGSFEQYRISCEVLSETPAKYTIKLIAPTDRHPAGHTMSVFKRNVLIPQSEPRYYRWQDIYQ